MFFSKVGTYKACGMFTVGHFGYSFFTITIVILAVIISLKKRISVKNAIRNCTISMLIFEFIMIGYKIWQYGISFVDGYLPLYYCSVLLYAGLLSTFGKGKFKRAGDVTLATGGLVGGTGFMFYPVTSLVEFPAFHLMSFHSFLFHGTMIYLGLLINFTNYVEIKSRDIVYHASIIGILCFVALIVNAIFDSNLMFISKSFPGSFIEDIYNITGVFFTPVLIISQLILPFYIIFALRKSVISKLNKALVNIF